MADDFVLMFRMGVGKPVASVVMYLEEGGAVTGFVFERLPGADELAAARASYAAGRYVGESMRQKEELKREDEIDI